jgi:hypothetical protein
VLNRYAMLSALIAAGIISAVSGPANASVGPTVYSLPDYQSGYQAQNSGGFQVSRATFMVPNASADGQAGLTGVSLTDNGEERKQLADGSVSAAPMALSDASTRPIPTLAG